MATIEIRTVKFTAMADGDEEDYRLSEELIQKSTVLTDFPVRLLDHLKLLSGHTFGYKVDRLTHSLQTASRAMRDGRDDHYVVMALLHDIGDVLAPHNHDAVAAAILEPYLPEDYHWIVRHHGIFQGYYYFHLDGLGRDRHARERFRDHPCFDATAEFCELYDQSSFDPGYPTLPLDAFEDKVRAVLSTPWAAP
ncbi:HD domain-containing protein [Parasphingopyxis sp.]|uniref:HD domain-containing protein n=1 Tax=Parasphingopyxis sp. TaxID=1920299 RepID=UPI002608A147|nr:HD domain-containing protein [Parasphingopyxis sp.]